MKKYFSSIVKKNQLLFFFCSTIFLIVGSVYLIQHKTPTKQEVSIEGVDSSIQLKKLNVGGVESASRLYKVTSKSGKAFLIASDGVLRENPLYTLEELHMNDFWNPVSCSRVPFVKRNADIFFYEIKQVREKDTEKLQASILKFDVAAKQLVQYVLPPNISTAGYIYMNENVPYIVLPKYRGLLLEGLLLYTLNEGGASLDYERTLDIRHLLIKNPVFKRYKSQFALSYFNDELNRHTLIYNGNTLKAEPIAPEETISFDENNFKLYETTASNFIRKINLLNFDHIQISDKRTNEIVLEIKDDGVNKYTITEL